MLLLRFIWYVITHLETCETFTTQFKDSSFHFQNNMLLLFKNMGFAMFTCLPWTLPDDSSAPNKLSGYKKTKQEIRDLICRIVAFKSVSLMNGLQIIAFRVLWCRTTREGNFPFYNLQLWPVGPSLMTDGRGGVCGNHLVHHSSLGVCAICGNCVVSRAWFSFWLCGCHWIIPFCLLSLLKLDGLSLFLEVNTESSISF